MENPRKPYEKKGGVLRFILFSARHSVPPASVRFAVWIMDSASGNRFGPVVRDRARILPSPKRNPVPSVEARRFVTQKDTRLRNAEERLQDVAGGALARGRGPPPALGRATGPSGAVSVASPSRPGESFGGHGWKPSLLCRVAARGGSSRSLLATRPVEFLDAKDCRCCARMVAAPCMLGEP